MTRASRLTPLRPGLVVRVREQSCGVAIDDSVTTFRYAPRFPSPRVERVSPGHLVAIAGLTGPDPAVVWRWYDAVVLGRQDGLVVMWEPAHGEVLARPRPGYATALPGTRAYLSAGLPGAEWWVAGAAVTSPENADVELREVERLYTEHGLWDDL